METTDLQRIGDPLPRSFYEREKHELAFELLGRDLVRRVDGELLAGRIVEVEVYGGPDDPASHANSGEATERTAAMFGPPGTAYVYRIYGIYHCLNVVAPARQKAAAVLIRALEPLTGRRRMAEYRDLTDKYEGEMSRTIEKKLLSGPGKICQALRIDMESNGEPLHSEPLWIASGRPTVEIDGEERIETSPRIGLNRETCGEAVDREWRYVDSESAFLSR